MANIPGAVFCLLVTLPDKRAHKYFLRIREIQCCMSELSCWARKLSTHHRGGMGTPQERDEPTAGSHSAPSPANIQTQQTISFYKVYRKQ